MLCFFGLDPGAQMSEEATAAWILVRAWVACEGRDRADERSVRDGMRAAPSGKTAPRRRRGEGNGPAGNAVAKG